MSEYIKKLENILEGFENYRFDDMSCAEWEELTTSVLKGAIAREKANKEADELANSIWNRLESREKGLPEPKLSENQEILLIYLKEREEDDPLEAIEDLVLNATPNPFTPDFKSCLEVTYSKLTKKEKIEVIQKFCDWKLNQC